MFPLNCDIQLFPSPQLFAHSNTTQSINTLVLRTILALLNCVDFYKTFSVEMFSTLARMFVLLLLPVQISAIDQDVNAPLVANMSMANTARDRWNLISNYSSWVYDHYQNPHFTWCPGSVTVADKATFPALWDMDLTISLLYLGPCSMLPPHLHPRANNAVVAVSGSTNTYMIQENGVDVVQTTLTDGKMTIFPRGSIHTMVNNGMSGI